MRVKNVVSIFFLVLTLCSNHVFSMKSAREEKLTTAAQKAFEATTRLNLALDAIKQMNTKLAGLNTEEAKPETKEEIEAVEVEVTEEEPKVEEPEVEEIIAKTTDIIKKELAKEEELNFDDLKHFIKTSVAGYYDIESLKKKIQRYMNEINELKDEKNATIIRLRNIFTQQKKQQEMFGQATQSGTKSLKDINSEIFSKKMELLNFLEEQKEIQEGILKIYEDIQNKKEEELKSNPLKKSIKEHTFEKLKKGAEEKKTAAQKILNAKILDQAIKFTKKFIKETENEIKLIEIEILKIKLQNLEDLKKTIVAESGSQNRKFIEQIDNEIFDRNINLAVKNLDWAKYRFKEAFKEANWLNQHPDVSAKYLNLYDSLEEWLNLMKTNIYLKKHISEVKKNVATFVDIVKRVNPRDSRNWPTDDAKARKINEINNEAKELLDKVIESNEKIDSLLDEGKDIALINNCKGKRAQLITDLFNFRLDFHIYPHITNSNFKKIREKTDTYYKLLNPEIKDEIEKIIKKIQEKINQLSKK